MRSNVHKRNILISQLFSAQNYFQKNSETQFLQFLLALSTFRNKCRTFFLNFKIFEKKKKEALRTVLSEYTLIRQCGERYPEELTKSAKQNRRNEEKRLSRVTEGVNRT